MIYNEFKELVVKYAKIAGLEQYELYYTNEEELTISTINDEVGEYTTTIAGGVCFRCIVNDKMGYASTELLNEDMAKLIVNKAIDNASTIESDDKVFINDGKDEYKEISKSTGINYTSDDYKNNLLKNYSLLKDKCEDVKLVEALALKSKIVVNICNSNGLDLSSERESCVAYTNTVVKGNDGDESGSKIDVSTKQDLDFEKNALASLEDAKSMLGATIPDTGVYDLVIGNVAMRSLLSAFNSIFKASSVQRGLSFLKGKIGEQIASEVVTIVDDPFCELSKVQASFDAEGCATKYKEVIKNGKLETFLYNMTTAQKDGVKTTGNASKASYDANVVTMPYSFYIKPSDIKEEELLKDVGNGIYIKDVGGLHAGANVITGDFSLISTGFIIENGKKTTPIKPFTISGNFYELLKKIEKVADNLEFSMPINTTAYGSPSVLVREISVAGK